MIKLAYIIAIMLIGGVVLKSIIFFVNFLNKIKRIRMGLKEAIRICNF